MFLPLSLCVTVVHSVCRDTIVHLMAKFCCQSCSFSIQGMLEYLLA